jgi:uncharacterized protein YndB with AHSA1/START domain
MRERTRNNVPAIRRQVNIAAAQRAVWNALTTSEGLTSWWADEARIEPRAGGRVVIGNKNGEDQVTEERGFIHTWRPTSRLEIAFDNVGNSELKGTRLSFSLARDGDETLLAMVHSGGEALEEEGRRQALDDEWKRAFKALQSHLDQAPS